MNLRPTLAVLLALSFGVSGCLETTEDVDVHPDGSLHVEVSAKATPVDLADGYPLPLHGPWRAANEETAAWLRDIGRDTGSAATRAAVAALPLKGEPFAKSEEEVLAVTADFASARDFPATFAPPLEAYASAHVQRSTTLSIESKRGRTVYVFERTLHGREFQRYDAWANMQEAVGSEIVRKVESQAELEPDELDKIVEVGVRALRGTSRALAEDALAAIWLDGDASLTSAGRERCLAAIDGELERVVTPEGQRSILDGLLGHAAASIGDEEAEQRVVEFERKIRDGLRATLANSLDAERVPVATRNAVLGQLEWLFTAVDQSGDLADENFVLRVRMPGAIVGGNYARIEDGRAVFETRGFALRDRTHVLRVVSVVE